VIDFKLLRSLLLLRMRAAVVGPKRHFAALQTLGRNWATADKPALTNLD
jgi:hypothetical protein